VLAHQCCETRRIEGAAAQHAMAIELPDISDFAERRARRQFGQNVGRVIVVFGQVLERCDPQIDFADLETDDFDIEIQPDQREVLELLRE